jgi:hypothetical protein
MASSTWCSERRGVVGTSARLLKTAPLAASWARCRLAWLPNSH